MADNVRPAKKASFRFEDLLKAGVKPPDPAMMDTIHVPLATDEAVKNLKEPKRAASVLAMIAIGLLLLGILVMLASVPGGLLLWIVALAVGVFAALTFYLHKKGDL